MQIRNKQNLFQGLTDLKIFFQIVQTSLSKFITQELLVSEDFKKVIQLKDIILTAYGRKNWDVVGDEVG